MISRRDMLAATAVGGMVTAAAMNAANAAPEKAPIAFGNRDDPPQGAINGANPRSAIDPGPQNPAIRDLFPSAFSPPATDVGNMPLSWASFNNAPRRIQMAVGRARSRNPISRRPTRSPASICG